MKIQKFALGFLALSLCSLSSCSLEKWVHRHTRPEELIPGATYEVRNALSPSSAFNRSQMRGTCYVLRPQSAPDPVRAGQSLAVRTTAYCHSEADHIRYGRLNAVGTPLKFGTVRSAAADWSRFPLGTRFKIKGEPEVTYVVDDYGSALVGSNTIDIYCTSRRAMNNWGVRHLNIEVVKWGSYEDSLEIIGDRVAYPHVRRMIQDIRTRFAAHPDVRSKMTPLTAMTAPKMLLRDS